MFLLSDSIFLQGKTRKSHTPRVFIFIAFVSGWDDFLAFGLIAKSKRALFYSQGGVLSPRWRAGLRWMARLSSLFVSLSSKRPSPHILCPLMRAGSSDSCEIELSAASISRCSSASTSSDTPKVLMTPGLGSLPTGKRLIERNERKRRERQRLHRVFLLPFSPALPFSHSLGCECWKMSFAELRDKST